jgi:hypothetical protein
VIKTQINEEKDYLTYFIVDREDTTLDNHEIKHLGPILK